MSKLNNDRVPMQRASVKSGDLLAWSRRGGGPIANVAMEAIKYLTKSNFGHVGIAWRMHDGIDDDVFVIEAVVPQIRIARLRYDENVYCVPMNIDWNTNSKQFLVSKLGLGYSLADGIRALLGDYTESDARWQCAELAHAFYGKCGISLPRGFTPEKVIASCMNYRNSPLLFIDD